MDASESAQKARALSALRPPPRAVPLGLRLRLMFGSPIALVGWIFLAVGGILSWAFVGSIDFSGWRYGGGVEQAQGVSTGCESTNMSVNKVRVYDNRFTFEGGTGRSFAPGSCVEAGRSVALEYPRGRPDLARIVGQRTEPFPPIVAFVLIFPALGAGLAGFALREGLREAGLLRVGMLARAKLVGKEPTNVTINDRRQYAMTLAFTDASGRPRRFVAKTCFPAMLEDEALENIFYDPQDPENAVAVDALPSSLFSDAGGELV